MIGDLQQLAPVVKDEEWEILKKYYDSMFFFSSRALKKTQHISIELLHIYRQSDNVFIEMLNKIRESKVDAETLRKLNDFFVTGSSRNTTFYACHSSISLIIGKATCGLNGRNLLYERCS